jgi:rod shape-determining protein MreD
VSGRRFALGAVTVLLAVLLQTTFVARLPLPGSPPDLVLVLVVAYALAEGSASGMITGFVAGLLADLVSDAELGRLALVYVVVGYLAGLADDETERSTLLPFVVVGLSAAGALVLYAAEGFLLGDPRASVAALARGLTSSVAYDVVLTPFVVPGVGLLVRRVDPDVARRRP